MSWICYSNGNISWICFSFELEIGADRAAAPGMGTTAWLGVIQAPSPAMINALKALGSRDVFFQGGWASIARENACSIIA